MNASVVITGSEILRGMRRDMLVQPITAQMVSRGVSMREVRFIGDDPETLVRTLNELEAFSDIIVVTGGLGLTPDDTTHFAVRKLTEAGKVRMSREIENPVGSAKGIDLDLESGTRVVFLPGVPQETFAMFGNVVKTFSQGVPGTVEVAVFGLREKEIADRLGDLAAECGYLPRDMEVALIVPEAREREVRGILGVHALDGADLNASVGTLLRDKGLSCATAESCTGGLIGHLMTDLAGSSDYFLGTVVAYSNDIKVKALGVPRGLIERHGAVSREVAEAMLRGVLDVTGADVGMATTGIAGPAGGSAEKPVGTVWIAAGEKDKHIVREFRFSFDRQKNKMIFAKTALFLLRSYVNDTGIHRI